MGVWIKPPAKCNSSVTQEDLEKGLDLTQLSGLRTIHIGLSFNLPFAQMGLGMMRSVLASTRHPVVFHIVSSLEAKRYVLQQELIPRLDQMHFYDVRCVLIFVTPVQAARYVLTLTKH